MDPCCRLSLQLTVAVSQPNAINRNAKLQATPDLVNVKCIKCTPRGYKLHPVLLPPVLWCAVREIYVRWCWWVCECACLCVRPWGGCRFALCVGDGVMVRKDVVRISLPPFKTVGAKSRTEWDLTVPEHEIPYLFDENRYSFNRQSWYKKRHDVVSRGRSCHYPSFCVSEVTVSRFRSALDNTTLHVKQ